MLITGIVLLVVYLGIQLLKLKDELGGIPKVVDIMVVKTGTTIWWILAFYYVLYVLGQLIVRL